MEQTLFEKRASQKSRILDLLKEAGENGVTNLQLNPISFRYSAHIFNLREQGYGIATDCVDRVGGIYKFTLVTVPPAKAA